MDRFFWRRGSVLPLFLLIAGITFAEPTVRDVKVSTQTRDGKVWTNLSGVVEVWTPLPVDRIFAVITDWPSYPRIFSTIEKTEPLGTGTTYLLDEVVKVSVLGIPIVNRFTLRVEVGSGELPGSVFLRWTQDHTDGTIDRLVGGWELEPMTSKGKAGTLVRYRNASSVVQSLPGQELVVRLFFPGELRNVVSSALAEAQRRKEKP